MFMGRSWDEVGVVVGEGVRLLVTVLTLVPFVPVCETASTNV